MSLTMVVKLVFAKSPSLLPNPVKSKRKQAMSSLASARLMREVVMVSLVQVKQSQNIAKATGVCSGISRRASSFRPLSFLNDIFKLRVLLMIYMRYY